MASPDPDSSKDSAKGGQSSTSGQHAGSPDQEMALGGEQTISKKRGKKRRRDVKEGKEGKKEGKKGKVVSPASPVERPSRERKSVVRYVATAPRVMPVTKAVTIQQGRGEKLKDIPNVIFKLSKRKSDESLRVLHKILFGRKANVHFLKRNILQFSGFVWSQNEEKDRTRVKEKLNKCNKDTLLEFCDLLDVYTLKVTTKKEEISEKLLEFLESPHATRDVVLSEKDTKGKKRRRGGAKGTGERSHEDASTDKEKMQGPKKDGKLDAKKARKSPAKAHKVDLVKGGSVVIGDKSEDKKDDAVTTTEHSNGEAEEDHNDEREVPTSAKLLSVDKEIDEHEESKSKENASAVRNVSRTKSKKEPFASATVDDAKLTSESKTSKRNKGSPRIDKNKATSRKDSKDSSTLKVPQKKGGTTLDPDLSNTSKKVEGKNVARTASKFIEGKKRRVTMTTSEDLKENKKQIAQSKSKNLAKKKGKKEVVFSEPTTEQLQAVASEILKQVDFNVATLADIIRQLGVHFNTDLMHRKAEIKSILEEVINSMTDEEEEDEDDNDDGGDAADESGEKN